MAARASGWYSRFTLSEQQTLSLAIPNQKNYGNWVRHHACEEASSRLALWMVKGGLLWLSSEGLAGKSHLIQAVFKEHPQVAILKPSHEKLSSVAQLKAWLNMSEHHAYWVLDLPSGLLSHSLGYAVFHLIERAKDMNKALLVSWRCTPDEMCPPELSSRLLMMEQVNAAAPSSDEDLKQVLESVLQTMQWDMKETVLPTLLQHVPRNLSDLLAAIETLDKYSRETGEKMNGAKALKVLGLHD